MSENTFVICNRDCRFRNKFNTCSHREPKVHRGNYQKGFNCDSFISKYEDKRIIEVKGKAKELVRGLIG